MSGTASYLWHRMINPLSVVKARLDGEFELTVSEYTARFSARSWWEPLSIYHTVKKEHHLLQTFLSVIEPDAVVYDIGANLGVYTAFATHAASAGQVIGFEPHPTLASLAATNVALNGENGRIEAIAIANETGTAELSIGGGIAHQRHALTGGNGVAVRVKALDDVLNHNEYPDPDVVKLDIEGAELDALRGMSEALRDSIEVVLCETHGDTEADVERLLTDASFRVVTVQRAADQAYLLGVAE